MSIVHPPTFNRRSDINSIRRVIIEDNPIPTTYNPPPSINRRQTNEQKHVLFQSIQAHKNSVTGLTTTSNGYLVSSSLDHTMKV